jgi:D-3-phosphoglycerate dehydrogenase
MRFVLSEGLFADPAVERDFLAERSVELDVAALRTPEEILDATAGADGIILGTTPMQAPHIAALGERVRIIGRPGVGLDSLDLEALQTRGVGVVHCPDYCVEEVATHALALSLAVLRGVPAGDAIARTDWGRWPQVGALRPVSRLTVGIVGCGRIGRVVAERFRPLAGEVVAYDRHPDRLPEGVRGASSLDALLAEADLVSLHMPVTPETIGLIGPEQLAVMKPEAFLVNVSRGRLVDEDALAAALHAGALAGAALDVLVDEPPAPDAAILGAPNVLLTPHVAWYSTESERRARITTVDGMLAYLAGEAPRAGRLAVDPRGAPGVSG